MFVSNDFPMIFMQQYYFCVSEYCFQDDFNPRCGRDEVIVMTQAFYGRMQIGRCIPRDLGYLGCKADALPFLDRHCSNKNQCSLEIPDDFATHPELATACIEGLTPYLEAEFYCEKGVS